MSRMPQRRLTEARLTHERQEIGLRMARLLERFHALEVLPLRLKLDWYTLPWYVRWWRTVRGRKLDIDGLVDARMKELEAQVIMPCPAQNNGVPCEHEDGIDHEGPHRRRSKLSGKGEYIEWEDEA